ncbi:MAG: AAA family ATPase [Bryobacteraceae bacterium]
MKLTAFRIYRYRSIHDSGWIEINPLTVLVGKNESGKTNVLKALHKFNPFTPEPYELDREWPRAQRRERNDAQPVCVTRFQLSPEESAEIARASGGKVAVSQIEIARDYKGRLEVAFPDGAFKCKLHPNPADAAADALPGLAEPSGDAFREQARRCLAEARRIVHEGRWSEFDALKEAHLVALAASYNPWNAAPSYENEQEFVRQYAGQLERIAAAAAAIPPDLVAAHEAVVRRLPAFLFMDEYRTFRGSASLDEVWRRKLNAQPTGEDRTLEMILELAGLSLASEVKNAGHIDREQRQYDLDDAAATLTRAIEGRWQQLRYEVKFAADGVHFFTFVRDHKDQALIKLEERSRGFQWFFSFDLLLMYESQGRFRDCVILLDEPGLALHPAAQRDLLSRLEAYAGNNTLLYTTHLPFMIDLKRPERIRVLSETPEGTVVTSDLTRCQPEARYTLEAALGIDGAASFLIAPRNLIVEGAGDYWILSELSSLFLRSGLEGLPEDVLVTPAAGAAEAASMATLMVGRNLDVVVLHTSPDPNPVMMQWLNRYSATVAPEVLSFGALAGRPGREFGAEELFGDDFYLELVRRVHKQELAAVRKLDLRGPERLSQRVARALAQAGIAFNPRAVTTLLRASLCRMRTADELQPETKAAAARVLKAIAAAIGKEKHFWAPPAAAPPIRSSHHAGA